jgi:hypothetical protein
MTDWPFTPLELTAGLRRYLADPTLRVLEVVEEPVEIRLPSTPTRGVGIDVERANHFEHYSYLLTQPKRVRLGLPGWGRREVGFHRTITPPLPFALPELVTADSDGKWIMLEPYSPSIATSEWTANEYRQAVISLSHFHDRFWGLAEDLSVYPWVAFPLANDFETVCLAAAKAVETIVQNGCMPVLCGSLERMTAVARLITQADSIARVLQSAPQTLLHGNYWPGNISIDEDRRYVVYDWQSVGVGPGILDLLAFVLQSQRSLSPLPIEPTEMISLYRYALATVTGVRWTDEEWERLWDYAVMWRFLQEQLPELADPEVTGRKERDEQLETLWLDPMTTAADRWLEKFVLI